MKTVKLPPTQQQRPVTDPYYPAAIERAREAALRLQALGIVDAEGNRIRKDIPPDMQEGSERDFGG